LGIRRLVLKVSYGSYRRDITKLIDERDK